MLERDNLAHLLAALILTLIVTVATKAISEWSTDTVCYDNYEEVCEKV